MTAKREAQEKRCPYCEGLIYEFAGTCKWCGEVHPNMNFGDAVKVRPVQMVCADCVRSIFLLADEYAQWEENHLAGTAMACPYCDGPLANPVPSTSGVPYNLVGVGRTEKA